MTTFTQTDADRILSRIVNSLPGGTFELETFVGLVGIELTDRVPTASRVTILAAHVEEETNELRARWGAAPTSAPGGDPVSWSVARSRLTPARWEALSHVERWELSYLLAARDATASNAEAWRWIAERNLLPGSQESVTNPSNAFDKRWRRYRDLVTG